MSALVAVVSVALTVLIAVAAHAGGLLLAAAVALTVCCLALGWGVLVALEHSRNASAGVVAVSGLAATGLARYSTDAFGPLAAFAVLLACCLLLAFAHQMLRRDGRPGLIESLTGTVSGQVLAVLSAGWVLLSQTRMGNGGLVIAATAVATAVVVVVLPLRRGLRGWLAFAAGVVASLIAVWVLSRTAPVDATVPAQLLLGIAVSAVGAGTSVLLAGQRTAHQPLGVLAAGAAPVCAVGTVAYAVARLVGG